MAPLPCSAHPRTRARHARRALPVGSLSRPDVAGRPLESLELRRDGLTFDALATGDPEGPLVLLLHGFPQRAVTWTAVAGRLADAGYRAVAPDQRGYAAGARPRRVGAYAVHELVADVLSMADQLGADRFHLVGHDWGGVVAWALAAAHPERLRSVTSVSTPHPAAFAHALGHSLQPLRSSYVGLFAVPGVAELVLGSGGGAGLRAALRASGLPKPDADRYAAAACEPGALRGALAWYRALVAGSLRRRGPTVGPITVPTLYVWGRHDTALGPVAARATARFVEAAYRFVELDAGHWIPETDAERLGALLVGHLDRHP